MQTHLQTLAVTLVLAAALTSCRTTETAASGVAGTAANAVHGVARTGATAVTGAAATVGGTVATAGSGIAQGNLRQATAGAAGVAVGGTAATAVQTGRSHVKTSSGVLKDTGATVTETSRAASGN